jgi:hypothetical protein
MNKQVHNELFVIEVYVALMGVRDMSVGFSIGVDFICGSQDDCGQLTSLDFGSFVLPLFAEKVDD